MNEDFMLDELYSKDGKYPRSGGFTEKFLYYKFAKDDIDVDVCRKNIDIYLNNNPFFDGHAECVNQENSENKYQIKMDGRVYRGDTIFNCMQLLLQIVNASVELESFSQQDICENHNIILKNSFFLKERELIDKFVMNCYRPGNFCVIPYSEGYSLNLAKGRLKMTGHNGFIYRDSADVYFRVLYAYYTQGIKGVSLIRLLDECKDYEMWRTKYRDNFVDYINDNKFHSFFDDKGPKEFWKKTDDWMKDITDYMSKVIEAVDSRTKKLVQ